MASSSTRSEQIEHLFRVAKGEACLHCQLMPEQHVDGKCPFEPTFYAVNERNQHLWKMCEDLDRQSKLLQGIDDLIDSIKNGRGFTWHS
jgi:hypothetical protein